MQSEITVFFFDHRFSMTQRLTMQLLSLTLIFRVLN